MMTFVLFQPRWLMNDEYVCLASDMSDFLDSCSNNIQKEAEDIDVDIASKAERPAKKKHAFDGPMKMTYGTRKKVRSLKIIIFINIVIHL